MYCLLHNLIQSILLLKMPFKSAVAVYKIQSLPVPECRTDLVSNLVFPSIFFLLFNVLLYFRFSFKFKFIFINFCICYFALFVVLPW